MTNHSSNAKAKSSAKYLVLGAVLLLGVGAFAFWRTYLSNATPATPLRVLCAENWLSEERLKRFADKAGVKIEYFTYARPGEFLRQMANADGKVDVLCASSWLMRSLAQSGWIRKTAYTKMRNVGAVTVDFLRLPFDPDAQLGVPLFWNLYVSLAPAGKPVAPAHRTAHLGG